MKSNIDIAELMRRLMQRIVSLDRAEKVCQGVTLSQAYTIEAIRKHDMIPMNELSQELGLAISTLTRVNDVLVRDGIVCRNPCETDRRKVNICLTEKGKELAEKLCDCSTKFWSDIIAAIPKEKHGQIYESLDLLLDVLEGVDQGCCQKDSID
ncbi:MarR family transcriptional regulator [candidate division KSB1 bacterium]|nr:MarR family transcriptional regulator [candidate division KSB1 bacterium]